MIHYKLETVLKEISALWDKHNIGRSEDERGKCAFMFGCLKTRYEKMYDDLPDNKKEDWNHIDKIVYIDNDTRSINGNVLHWNGKDWIKHNKKQIS